MSSPEKKDKETESALEIANRKWKERVADMKIDDLINSPLPDKNSQ